MIINYEINKNKNHDFVLQSSDAAPHPIATVCGQTSIATLRAKAVALTQHFAFFIFDIFK